MRDVLEKLDRVLGILQSQSNHGLQFSYYRMPSYAGYEIYISWPNGSKLSFSISEISLLVESPEAVLMPYIKKALDHEEIMSSPLYQALR